MAFRVAREDAFGGGAFETKRLRLPWTPSEGLFVDDLFAGARRHRIELPQALVDRGTFPYVILSCFDGDSAFVAQRWFDRPVATWERIGAVNVDSASVCLMPESVAAHISGNGLSQASRVVHDAPDLWAQVSLDAQPVLGIRVTKGVGVYPLYVALDDSGELTGWVLELGVATTT